MTRLPAFAAFRHHTVREGFEIVYPSGDRFLGQSTGLEDGRPFTVRYEIEVDEDWICREARISDGARTIHLERGWRIDGRPAPHLDGCLDVDLEASAVTNAFPARRVAPGESAQAPAVWVRLDLTVERLEQRYACTAPGRLEYAAPDLDFTAALVYDPDGLIREYPGLATRVA